MKNTRLMIVFVLVFFSAFLFGGETMKGQIVTQETKNFVIHSYMGYSGDVTNIIELEKELILLDGQTTKSATAELNEYIKKLNKPIHTMLITSHGIGNIEVDQIIGTTKMAKFIASGSANVFIDAFSQRFGEDMIKELLEMKPELKEGMNKIAGLEVEVKTDVNGFPPCSDLYFEDGKIIFTHLAADNTHLLIPAKDSLPAIIKFWKSAQSADYVMSSHFTVIGKEGIEYSLNYAKTAKEVLNSADTKDEFIAGMKKTYPKAGMDFFLMMTADNLYK